MLDDRLMQDALDALGKTYLMAGRNVEAVRDALHYAIGRLETENLPGDERELRTARLALAILDAAEVASLPFASAEDDRLADLWDRSAIDYPDAEA